MLRKLVFLTIFIATTIGVSGLINGWPRTAIACGVIVVLFSTMALVFDHVARKHMQNTGK